MRYGNQQKQDKDAVPFLIQALQDADSGVCVNVTTALGWRTRDTVPSLIQALQDQDVGVCQGVVEALENIDTPEALKAVEEYESRQ